MYTFGAPGHGKGTWDGLGGAWKNVIHHLIKSSHNKNELIPGVHSGYINSVRDVHAALSHHYDNENNRERSTSENRINKYKFFLYVRDAPDSVKDGNNAPPKNEIPRPVEELRTLDGIKSHYQFAVGDEGIVYMRCGSCFCMPCFIGLWGGTFNWRDTKDIAQCEKTLLGETSAKYRFTKELCTKTAGPGVQQAVINRGVKQNEMASKLAVGDWVLVDGGDDQYQPIWLGRVMSNKDWDGQGVKVNDTNSVMVVDGMRIKKGEVAMNIIWYEKIDLDSEDLDYHISRHETHPIVQRSRSLLHAQFDIPRMIGRDNPVPRHRERRATSQAVSLGEYYYPTTNFQSSVTGWHDREFGSQYKMEAFDQAQALQRKDMQ